MNRPWMPFYVADYLADTGHLSTTQHGAYCLLIMHYWRTGGLPDDNAKLAKITKLSRKTWEELIRPDIEPLFRPGWRHKRIDEELVKVEEMRLKRVFAGKKSGEARKGFGSPALSNRVSNRTHVQQVMEKPKHVLNIPQVITITSIPCLESEGAPPVEKPQVASDEEQVEKQPAQISRKAFDELLAKRKASA